LTIEQAAHVLGVSTTTVRRLIVTGHLQATQPVAYAPWAIAPDQLSTEPVQQAVAAVKAGRRFPRTAPETQLTLTNGGI
jgi:helix-turn-helix protein